MVKEAYVSFETAKLLKEKGFDYDCFVAYNVNGNIESAMELYGEETITNGECSEGDITAPTQQMAMAWLREKYNKHCKIGYDIQLEWYYDIIDLKETTSYDYEEMKCWHSESNFKSFEQAVDAAILECLTNLI